MRRGKQRQLLVAVLFFLATSIHDHLYLPSLLFQSLTHLPHFIAKEAVRAQELAKFLAYDYFIMYCIHLFKELYTIQDEFYSR